MTTLPWKRIKPHGESMGGQSQSPRFRCSSSQMDSPKKKKKTPESRTGKEHEVGGEFFTCFFCCVFITAMLNGVFVFLFGGKTEPIEGRGVPFVLICLWGYPSVHQPKGFQDIYVKADWAPAKPKWSLQVTLFRTVLLFLFFLLNEADQRSTKATSLSIHQMYPLVI